MNNKFILDTCIVLGILRGSSWAEDAVNSLDVFDNDNFVYISKLSVVELNAMAYRLNWGQTRIDNLNSLLSKILQVDISNKRIEDKFVEIDAYSQNKHHNIKIPKGHSAFKLGDHDTWIAATASAMNARLITSDKDFDPLDPVFLIRSYVDQK